MKYIYKYTLNEKEEILSIPLEKILDAQIQDNNIIIWAIINTEFESKEYMFKAVFTGKEYNDLANGGRYFGTEYNFKYIATVQLRGLVYHLFYDLYRPI